MTRHDPTDATDDGRTDAPSGQPTTDGTDRDGPAEPPAIHAVSVRYGDTDRVLYSPTDGGTAATWIQADRSALVDLEAHR